MIATYPDQIWFSGHYGEEQPYLLATSQRRAAPEMLAALIHARRIIIAACTANAPGSDPTEHNAVKEIDAALAKADGREQQHQ